MYGKLKERNKRRVKWRGQARVNMERERERENWKGEGETTFKKALNSKLICLI